MPSPTTPKVPALTSQPPASEVAGNASLEDKDLIIHLKDIFTTGEVPGAAEDAPKLQKEPTWSDRLRADFFLTSLETQKPIAGLRPEVVAEFQLTCSSYMCNAWGMAHGGMISTLLDVTTSLPVPLFMREQAAWAGSGLTQSLHVNFMAPALKGETLRVIARTRSGSKRQVVIDGELWGPRGLVATCTQVKMTATTGPASLLAQS